MTTYAKARAHGGKYYSVHVEVLVPTELPAWVARQLGVPVTKALEIVRHAVEDNASISHMSAERWRPTSQDEAPRIWFSSNYSSAPKDGAAWFDCRAHKARRMHDKTAIDDSEGT